MRALFRTCAHAPQCGARVSARHYGVRAVESRRPPATRLPTDHTDTRRYPGTLIQLLPRRLQEKVFGVFRETPEKDVLRTMAHLELQDIVSKDSPPPKEQPHVEFDLPPLESRNLNAHFREMADVVSVDYLYLCEQFERAKLPAIPSEWRVDRAGWCRYAPRCAPEHVPHPTDAALVFDVEVCVKDSKCAVMAVAASEAAWYVWLSPRLLDPSVGANDYARLLVPFGHLRTPRIIVGHNVAYDRARILDEYVFDADTQMRFVDTMAMHTVVGGRADFRRGKWQAHMRTGSVGDGHDHDGHSQQLRSSPSSLAHVYRRYCGKRLSKGQRNVFVHGSLDDIRSNLGQLVSYCANDVAATHAVYAAVHRQFVRKCPHAVSRAATLELGSSLITVDSSWAAYVAGADAVWARDEALCRDILWREMLRTVRECASKREGIEEDPWLSSLDRTDVNVPDSLRTEGAGDKTLAALVAHVAQEGRPTTLPSWVLRCFTGVECTEGRHRRCDEGDEDVASTLTLDGGDAGAAPFRLTSTDPLTPVLLQLSWNDRPIVKKDDEGWGTRVQYSRAKGDTPPPDKPAAERMGHQPLSQPLEHGAVQGVVSDPLNRDTLAQFGRTNRLKSKCAEAGTLFEATLRQWDWKGTRARVRDAFVVPVAKLRHVMPAGCNAGVSEDVGIILPQIRVAGTLARRPVEPLWLVARNAEETRNGSELKARVVAPPGRRFVGADVDSGELWIASVIGDATFARMHGSTAIGYMAVEGKEEEGSDVHSRTARLLGISRDEAKLLDDARLHGAGQSHSEALIARFLAERDVEGKDKPVRNESASERAKILFRVTKGTQQYHLDDRARAYTKRRCRKNPFTSPEKLERSPVLKGTKRLAHYRKTFKAWKGGRESHMFNALERIAKNASLTPVLGCQMPDSLRQGHADVDELRVNWVVQSTPVDLLHLMLVSMRWLSLKFGIDCRFALGAHDEIRYLSSAADEHRTALALQITHLWARAMCAYSMGMDELPLSTAFFSAVDIDKVLRKDVRNPCLSPSNAVPVPPGNDYTIHDTIAITKGVLERGAADEARDSPFGSECEE